MALDAQTIAVISSTVTALGVGVTGWVGYKAKQAEQRYNTQIATEREKIKVDGGTTLNEREEAGRIRIEQREEIKGLRERLDLKDKQIDDLQDDNRKLLTKIERLEAVIEQLRRELSEASRNRERTIDLP